MEISTEGWTFTDSTALEWQERGPGVAMNVLGIADGRMLAMFNSPPDTSVASTTTQMPSSPS